MISIKFRSTACFAVLCCICLFPSARLMAQAPAGPLPPTHPLPPPPPAPPAKKKPEVEPRKTLAGYWKLNTEDSDDPQKKLEEGRQTRAGSGGGPGAGPGGGPGSGPGGGPGGRGGPVGIGFPYPGSGGGGNGPWGGGGRRMGGDVSDTTE